jgi:hypothetical protein|tara:strand:+ start:538 stop:795 length:258 start_codon:yes stop_codon:yes gene_type:complete
MTFTANLKTHYTADTLDAWVSIKAVSPQDAALKYATDLASTGTIQRGQPVIVSVCGPWASPSFDHITVTPSGAAYWSFDTAKAAA